MGDYKATAKNSGYCNGMHDVMHEDMQRVLVIFRHDMRGANG
jgi:hypothetical protein